MENNVNKKNSDARIRANAKYNSKAYKKIQAYIKPDDYTIIDNYCNARGISKAAFIVGAARYIIDNNIMLSDNGGADPDIGKND